MTISARDKEIVRRRRAGESYGSIAADVGMTDGGIFSIVRRFAPETINRGGTSTRNRPATTRGRILIVLGAVDYDAAESLLVMLAAPAPLDKAHFFSESHDWRHKPTARRDVNSLRATVLGSLRGLVREGHVVVTGPGRYALSERVEMEAAA